MLSLQACAQALAASFPQEEAVIPTRELSTGVVASGRAPRYLYRGESKHWPSTRSSIDRLRADHDLADEIEHIVGQVKAFTARELRLMELGAHAFVQHYGLPTELIDFTCELNVAAAFASDGQLGQEGCIGILDVTVAKERIAVVDLRNLNRAERAIRQRAFGVHPLWHDQDRTDQRDLKRREVCEALGLKWFPFRREPEDSRFFDHQQLGRLKSVSTDPIAGWLRHAINVRVIEQGKLNDRIADWLANRVPMVPLVARTRTRHPSGRADLVEFTPPASAGFFDESIERERSRRFWSEAFPEDILPTDEGFLSSEGVLRFSGT